MDEHTTGGGSFPPGTNRPGIASRPADERVDQLSGTAHQAVDSAAGAAAAAGEWASAIPEQARRAQYRLAESTCESIREHPIAAVASVLVVGYLLGRLARL